MNSTNQRWLRWKVWEKTRESSDARFVRTFGCTTSDCLHLFAGKNCLALSAALFRGVAESILKACHIVGKPWWTFWQRWLGSSWPLPINIEIDWRGLWWCFSLSIPRLDCRFPLSWEVLPVGGHVSFAISLSSNSKRTRLGSRGNYFRSGGAKLWTWKTDWVRSGDTRLRRGFILSSSSRRLDSINSSRRLNIRCISFLLLLSHSIPSLSFFLSFPLFLKLASSLPVPLRSFLL